MLLSIIIVNYNTFQLTCNCIESIIHHTRGVPYEIILVDNASPKDNPEDFLKRFPQVKLVKSPVNGGFANGNNRGIAHANGDLILLMNTDVVLQEDSIAIAAKYLAQHRKLGMLSIHLVYEDGKYQHNARRFRSIRNELLDLCRPALKLLPYKKRARLMLNQYFRGDFDVECDWVSGAFLMFPKALVNQLPGGQLDERFFMYGEDQLWCYQAEEAGYTNYFLSGTKAIHIANASTDAAKQLKLIKTMVANELEIMRYRKGLSPYYYTFKLIFMGKELARYYIKVLAYKLFKYRIR